MNPDPSTATIQAVGACLAAAGAVAMWCSRPVAVDDLAAALPRNKRSAGTGRLRVGAIAACAALVVLGGSTSGSHLAAAAVFAAAGVLLLRQAGRSRRRREGWARRQRVVDFHEAVVGELRAGQPVLAALQRSAEHLPEVSSAVAASRLGADVGAALRRTAAEPGAEELSRLAAAWDLCSATGASLAEVSAQVLQTARAEQSVARLVQAEIAAARATAKMMCLLPPVVLWAAQGIGARPVHFLLDTSPGVVCLAAGTALLLGGLTWIDRIAESAVGGGG